MSRNSKSSLEQEGRTSKSVLLVIGIGVKFPFLSYRASAKKCQLKSSIYEKLENHGRHTEKRIRQCDCIYFCHRGIVDKVRIDEEENRHINSFPGVEPLLFEAKALNFAKIRRHLRWSNTIGSDPNNVLGALVRCRIKSERCFPRQNSDFSLLWCELPGHYIRY